MNTDKTGPIDADILIVGAGIAGLYTALKLAPRNVTVITARRAGHGGSSGWAQGGLAAAMGPQDSPAAHLADTVAAGAGLVDEHAAHLLCTAGPDCVRDLAAMGVPFDQKPNGDFALGREAAHGQDRIVHVGGDEAGATIMRVLTEQANAHSQNHAPQDRGPQDHGGHITLREGVVAHRLITQNNRVIGVEGWDIDAQAPVTFRATETILATGGAGGLYAMTTNPLSAQGHGLAMAYEAGAVLRDLEFMQFHPTGIDIGKDPAPLATEALRGDGATLHDVHGRRFMPAHHPDAELGPRDVVARGVAQAIAQTGGAFLDARSPIGPRFQHRYPTVYSACMEAGINPALHPIPIAPAAHYHMGGILTDHDGRTTLDGLWAVGEVASTGVHGANRLASNSLLEALVFGQRAADALNRGPTPPNGAPLPPLAARQPLPIKPPKSLKPARRVMADKVGLLRDADALGAAAEQLAAIEPMTAGDRLALLTARLVIAAAQFRQESRGAHQRADYQDLATPAHTHIQRGPNAAPQITAHPHFDAPASGAL